MKKRSPLIILSLFLSLTLLFSACTTSDVQSTSPAAGVGSTTSAASAESSTDNTEQATSTYAQEMEATAILTLSIQVDEAAWQAMLDSGSDETYIAADITINGTTIQNAGIRPKGNSSRSAIAGDDTTNRYSFKIKFDKFVDGQTWLGLDKLNLNSNYSDASSMKEYISYDIMNFIGVDTVLYCYADISVNGESWGFYLALEDYEDSYRDRAKDGGGQLYKPESMEIGDGMGGMQERPKDAAQDHPSETDTQSPTDDSGTQKTPAAGEEVSSDDPAPEDGTSPRGQMPPGNFAKAGEDPTTAFPFDSGNLPEDFQPPEDWNGEPPNGMEIPQFGGEKGDFGPGGMGGVDNGVSLTYIDDSTASYSAIFDNNKTKTTESDEQRVVTAIKNLNAGTDLERYVDVDATLRYLAAHTIVVNLDSYSGSFGHNYILYETNGQISMLPWDYNMAFGGFQSFDAASVVNFPIDTPVSGIDMADRPMIAKLLEHSDYLARYHQYLREIIDGYFAEGAFDAKIDALDTAIASYIQNDPSAFYPFEAYQTAVATLKTLGNLRAESVAGQLDGTVPSTTDGQTENPDALIPADSIDLSALGSMGGFRGQSNGFDGPNFQAAAPSATTPADAAPEESAAP